MCLVISMGTTVKGLKLVLSTIPFLEEFFPLGENKKKINFYKTIW